MRGYFDLSFEKRYLARQREVWRIWKSGITAAPVQACLPAGLGHRQARRQVRKPIFELKARDGVVGAHFSKVKESRDLFERIGNRFLENVEFLRD
jgi:hypothetical protein